jgi:tRNA threonylcarbamoyl adenosine modification protein (Sua5/YciO/YrdC/YwlC family)
MKTVSTNEAIAKLQAGGVGIMPTDTIYGLVARAADKDAVARLYELKRRDKKPGTTIAASVEQLVGLGIPKRYLSAVEHLWPNPLSIEIPQGPQTGYLHQETGRSAFRVVADENIRAILEQTGPLVTSSANQPGEPSSMTIDQAWDYFKDEDIDFYVDGGDLSGRNSSTVIRIIDDAIEVVRQGAVKIDETGRITQ